MAEVLRATALSIRVHGRGGRCGTDADVGEARRCPRRRAGQEEAALFLQ